MRRIFAGMIGDVFIAEWGFHSFMRRTAAKPLRNFLLFAATFFLATCKKSKPETTLPPATQEGKNTVGFTINGEVWVPFYKCGFGQDPCGEISARYSTPFAAPDAISFQFERRRKDKSSSLTISSSMRGTVRSIGNKVDSISAVFLGENSAGNNDYYYGPLPGSKFIITKIDHQAQIISGEFELILIEQNGSGKEISIKDGRFDFKFNACKCSN